MSRAARQEPTARGRDLRVGQARLEIKIDPAAAPSQLFAFESTLPPGGGMPYFHLHHEMEEAFYVREGTIEYTCGDQTILAKAGSMIQIPSGVAHNCCVHVLQAGGHRGLITTMERPVALKGDGRNTAERGRGLDLEPRVLFRGWQLNGAGQRPRPARAELERALVAGKRR